MYRLYTVIGTMLLVTASANADDAKVLFEDDFAGKVAEGWTWVLDDESARRFTAAALELHHDDQMNGLKRELPARSAGDFVIEVTLTSLNEPDYRYEQVGLFWLQGGGRQHKLKLVKELIDGKLYMYPGKIPMTAATVQLRLVVRGDKVEAQFRPNAKGDFQTAFTDTLPPAGKSKEYIAIQCWKGAKGADHWVRANQFRILSLPSSK